MSDFLLYALYFNKRNLAHQQYLMSILYSLYYIIKTVCYGLGIIKVCAEQHSSRLYVKIIYHRFFE